MFTRLSFRSTRYSGFLVLTLGLIFVLAACGGDDDGGDDSADGSSGPEPTPVASVEESATPEPDPTPETSDTSDDVGENADPTPTEEPEEPAEDVDLAPELTGLTDWRNTDPVSLEDFRGEPVVLVFWNSM